MRRESGLVAAVFVALVAVLVALSPGDAAAASPATLRLTQLSPDTPSVDVTITSGSGRAYQLRDLAYGSVSPYAPVDPDTYTMEVRPAGVPTAPPIVTGTVRTDAGGAYTAAVLRPTTGASVTQFTDDLARPGPGGARVRLLDAAPDAGLVSATWNGAQVASPVAFGAATGYVDARPGTGTFVLTPTTGAPVTLSAAIAAGGVYTVVVLPRDGRLSGNVNLDTFDSTVSGNSGTSGSGGPGGTGAGGTGGGQFPNNTTPNPNAATFAVLISGFDNWDSAVTALYELCGDESARPAGLNAADCRSQGLDFVRGVKIVSDPRTTPPPGSPCSATWDKEKGQFTVASDDCTTKLTTHRDADIDAAVTKADLDPDKNFAAFVAVPATSTSPTAGPTTGPTSGPTTGPTTAPPVGPSTGPTTAPVVGPSGPSVGPIEPPTDPGTNGGGGGGGGSGSGGSGSGGDSGSGSSSGSGSGSGSSGGDSGSTPG